MELRTVVHHGTVHTIKECHYGMVHTFKTQQGSAYWHRYLATSEQRCALRVWRQTQLSNPLLQAMSLAQLATANWQALTTVTRMQRQLTTARLPESGCVQTPRAYLLNKTKK